ncbi:hypothetical protein [Mycobacterium riyadhense]|uniref:Uncharacterized protein n=1 Tax=Mycobacterium riyadhense TaxID=486698 RepID=A0A1X2CLE6_9MYCO|nr:hypothetical protein [Mycobacterium riyadhense]MCV7148171.1 hypothetical protein [Mycobacterium riyadhense]ORW76621.1 hypothetical protein AWC22_21215 [Mycobacterium riyadhense]VTP01284.1 hypothetical protein BIN_B_03977 [Mycobacterium riyadhense]
MHDADGAFRDDIPIADAVEQQRPTSDFSSFSSEEEDEGTPPYGDVPLETTASDWQQQREPVPIDPELEEFDDRES